MKPPVPITAPSEKRKSPASSASEVLSITCSSPTCRSRIRAGSTWTCSCSRCSPQIATLATPGTRRSRALIFQYAIVDSGTTPTVFDDTPIFMTRLVVEVGGIMNGGAAQVGRDGVTASTRSWTSCRAWSTSVSSLKSSSMDESCGTDFERMTSSPSTPFSDCSSGMLTSDSTSAADSPRQIVWISTRGGANSGKASTGMSRSCCVPNAMSAAASATTRKRNFRLDPTIHRISAGRPSVLLDAAVLDAPELVGADGHNLRAGRGPGGENRRVAVDPVDADVLPDEDELLRARVRPRSAVRVVEHGGIGDHRALALAPRRDGLDV